MTASEYTGGRQTGSVANEKPRPTKHRGAGRTGFRRVELRGFEPLAFSLRTRRATNCATAPKRDHDNTGDGRRPRNRRRARHTLTTMRLRMPSSRAGRADPADLPRLGAPPPRPARPTEPVDPDPAHQPAAWQVPIGVRTASEWAWRLIVVGAALYGAFWLFAYLSEVTVPLVVALLLAALLHPLVHVLSRALPRGAAAGHHGRRHARLHHRDAQLRRLAVHLAVQRHQRPGGAGRQRGARLVPRHVRHHRHAGRRATSTACARSSARATATSARPPRRPG